MRSNGFTVLELLIAVIIVGVLAILATTQYNATKENTLDKEAQDNLKLIYAQERIFKVENTAYNPGDVTGYGYSYANSNSDINSKLGLRLPTTNVNWNYSILTCNANNINRFTVRATRVSDGKIWCINSIDPSSASSNDPVPVQPPTDCGCPGNH